jgi:diacylglycerol kinase (ATP)
MKIALIANPFSGGFNTTRTLAEVKQKLYHHDIRFDLFLSSHHQHPVEIAKSLPLFEYDAIVSMGGDGTNYQVLNGLLKNQDNKILPPLGIIPAGRGNSFARDLEIFSINDGISAIAGQTSRPVDVCSFTQGMETHYFVNLMGFGFVTDVARTAAYCNRLGDASYIIGVLHRMLGLRFHEMELEIDGVSFSGENCFVEFCNSRYTGGDMIMAPHARIDDGFFDVVILGPLSRISLLKTLPGLFKGTHGKNKSVQFVRGKNAIVRTIPEKTLLPDGEIFGITPTEINILPSRVRFLF